MQRRRETTKLGTGLTTGAEASARASRMGSVLAIVAVSLVLSACASTPAGRVRFVMPSDGDVVTSPVAVEMEAIDIDIEPAANGVGEGRGHFHVMIDAPCVEARLTVPQDRQHVHFGQGQTTATLDLDPGIHFLCLQAADGNHTALPLTDEITITVRTP